MHYHQSMHGCQVHSFSLHVVKSYPSYAVRQAGVVLNRTWVRVSILHFQPFDAGR